MNTAADAAGVGRFLLLLLLLRCGQVWLGNGLDRDFWQLLLRVRLTLWMLRERLDDHLGDNDRWCWLTFDSWWRWFRDAVGFFGL